MDLEPANDGLVKPSRSVVRGKRILEQEKLISAEGDPRGCILMNMHKAKGKGFDGMVLVEGSFKSAFFDGGERPPHERSPRLLRVAITEHGPLSPSSARAAPGPLVD